MYKINDRAEAIRMVQVYLSNVGDPDIFIAPTGVFDENTRLSVESFQRGKGFTQTGIVDKETFDSLYKEYLLFTERQKIRNLTESFMFFPILAGIRSDGMMHINIMLFKLLDYYGYTHSLRENNFYSSNTAEAVKILSNIYLLEYPGYIDEFFYSAMIRDYNSISKGIKF